MKTDINEAVEQAAQSGHHFEAFDQNPISRAKINKARNTIRRFLENVDPDLTVAEVLEAMGSQTDFDAGNDDE